MSDDESYGNDDFDDYEFEDFEDSETEDRDDSVDITDHDINFSQPHENTNNNIADVGTGTVSQNQNNEEDDLGSTSEHNRQVIDNLMLKELSSENTDTNLNTATNNNNNNNNNDNIIKKDVGANTLMHSISTELRQMMLDEERQNKENVRASSPVRVPESGKRGVGGKKYKSKKNRSNKQNNPNNYNKNGDSRVRSPVSFSTVLLPGEEGLTDNSSSQIEGNIECGIGMSSIETHGTSPSKIIKGPGSEAWKSQLDSYSHVHRKCIENEKKRVQGSRFIQSQVSHDSKHHRSTVERQLRAALQQVSSYRKENTYLTKMIDASCIQSEFNSLRVQNEEQAAIIKQLTEERRSLLLVQRNQEKTLLETEKEKESLPEQEHINQKKMNVFQKKVKSLRDNLYHYQVKTREEKSKNKILTEQNTKLKVKLKAMMITQSVAEQLKRDQLGLTATDDNEPSQSIHSKFEHLGVGDEATASKQESTTAISEKEESIEELRIQRNKLKSIVDNQRSSFRNQLVVLQTKLEKSLVKRKELEDELVRREKEMKAQIQTVKELNKTCEELTISNLELLEASSLYSKKTRRTIQSSPAMVIAPRPPSQSFAHRPSPNTARPKEAVMANDNENTFLTGQCFEDVS